jgi:hypothetical protein
MRKTIVAMFALAAVGLFHPIVASAHGAGGFGGGGGYPASFGSDYAEGRDCRLVAHRVKTHHGWRTRQIQVCS